MDNQIIPIHLQKNTLHSLGWTKEDKIKEGSLMYYYSKNPDIKAYIPQDENRPDYLFHQKRNIELILQILDLEPTLQNIQEIEEQILFPNYKLINRVVNKDNRESVPFEFVDRIIRSTISAFKTEYVLTSAKQIPVEKFQMNHTRKGSFIIPISIPAEYDDNTLLPIPSLTNRVLKNYLDKIKILTQLDLSSEKSFANKIIDHGINSKIVKDFLSKEGLAKYTLQYKDIIQSVELYGESSPILDFALPKSDKIFNNIEVNKLQEVPIEYIKYLESIEIQTQQEIIDENDITIEAIVDSLGYKDKARNEAGITFTIYKVANQNFKKPFKALAKGLTRKRLKKFGEIIHTAEIVKLRGDITKAKGKMGDLRIEEILESDKQNDLFSENND